MSVYQFKRDITKKYICFIDRRGHSPVNCIVPGGKTQVLRGGDVSPAAISFVFRGQIP